MKCGERPRIVQSRRGTVLVMVVAATAIVGCGDRASAPVASLPAGSAPPATRLAVPMPEPGDAGYVTVPSLQASSVDEPCPTEESIDMNPADSSIITDESSRLEPMLGVVLRYGSERPEVFGGYGLHWHRAGDASVFVSFTGDIAEHRVALNELVEYPDELIVCQAPASEVDRIAIQSTLIAELDGRFTGIGSGGKTGAVTIGLNPVEEALAADLVERYGAAVDITVGALKFPLSEAVAVCDPRVGSGLIDGLEITVLDADDPVVMTEVGTVPLSIELTNTANETIRFGSGQPSMTITDVDGTARTSDPRAFGDIGIEISLEPGASQTFDLEVSLASCDPADGYLLPPGQHFVTVSLYNDQLRTNMTSKPLSIVVAEP